MKIQISEVQIKPGRREADAEHIRELADSIKELGLLNPITVDKDNTLIAGLHRLEAAKLLDWPEIECTVSSLEGLQAELAEIDENFVRNDLSTLEYGEILLRRKEIYEALHPETKAGTAQAVGMNRIVGNNVDCKMQTTSKSFINDTAEKLGVHPCTVARQIQTAKNLTPETKEIIKGTDTKISKKAAMKLSRLKPEQQEEAAALLAAKEIKTVDEYTMAKQEPRKTPAAEQARQPVPAVPFTLQEEPRPSFREMVADLKNTEKECACTPDMFLTEYSNFARKLVKEMEWYAGPLYEEAFPCLSEAQLNILRQQTDSICSAASELFSKIERTKKL